MLVPDSLRTPAEGLPAVADRMVWAFGTPLARLPWFRWWRLPAAVVWWAEMRGHQDQFATWGVGSNGAGSCAKHPRLVVRWRGRVGRGAVRRGGRGR